MRLSGLVSAAVFTPTLIACYAITFAIPGSHRGEAVGTYYLASSLAIALGPPLGFGLYALGGMRLELAVVSLCALVLAGLLFRVPRTSPTAAAGRGPFKLVSVRALP